MSVNWECTDCQAYKDAMAFDEDSKEWVEFVGMRDSMIYATLVTGYPKGEWAITQKNCHEMFRRMNIVEQVFGAYRRGAIKDGTGNVDGFKPVYFTYAEVRSMIGLHTNAGTKTDVAFRSHIYQCLKNKANERLNQQLDEMCEAQEA